MYCTCTCTCSTCRCTCTYMYMYMYTKFTCATCTFTCTCSTCKCTCCLYVNFYLNIVYNYVLDHLLSGHQKLLKQEFHRN